MAIDQLFREFDRRIVGLTIKCYRLLEMAVLTDVIHAVVWHTRTPGPSATMVTKGIPFSKKSFALPMRQFASL
jgi:hypothetical protein